MDELHLEELSVRVTQEKMDHRSALQCKKRSTPARRRHRPLSRRSLAREIQRAHSLPSSVSTGDALSRGARPCAIPGLSYCYLHLVTIPAGGVWVMGYVLKRSLCLVSLGVLCFACGGCASPGPATPSFAAMPGRGKSYEAFQRDDQYCQSSAQQAIGYQSPGQAANQAAVGTAAVGTALGAVAGAAIGSVSGNMGTGAALGAGTGLVAGSAIGAGNADAAGGSLQVRYDTVYAQCMTAKGNRIGGPPVAEPVYVYPPPYYWGPRYYFSYGW